jgi:hypothetical protein
MLTHNSAVIFVMSISLVILAAAGGTLPRRLAACAGIMLISLTPWFIIRLWLGQEGSHSISKPMYAFIDYAGQVPREIGLFFISSSSRMIQGTVGVIILVTALILWARRPRSDIARRHRVLIGLALAALAGHFLVFNLVWIDSAIGDRLIWFFALAVAPVFFCIAKKRIEVVALLLLLTVGVSGWRVVKLAWHGESPPLTVDSGEKSPLYIYSPYFLTSRADAIVPAGAIRVRAPIYPWQMVPPGMKDQVEAIPMVKLITTGTGEVR